MTQGNNRDPAKLAKADEITRHIKEFQKAGGVIQVYPNRPQKDFKGKAEVHGVMK